MTRIWKRLLSVLMVCIFGFLASINALAAETTQDAEKQMTEEEKKAQEELDKAYAIPTESNAWEGWPEGPGTYGEAAIVMEVGTGTILYAKNIDAKMYPASITKVLTALLAFEYGDLTDTVAFSHDCVSFLQYGDSSIGLKEGDVITLEQALYATLLASANEAAYAVGENVGKNAGHDYNWFIDQMNAKIQELGGVNSHFVNTNGLHDPDHYTCARDMALIGRALFDYPQVFWIMQTLQYTIPKSDTVEEHVFQQKDKMLRPEDSNYYKNAIGGKTGFTSDARSTLITMADNGEMQLVAVVLRTYGKNVYPDTTHMLKYAFKNFEKIPIDGNETSTDVGGILPGKNDIESYVVVPKGTAFSDLQMTMTPDEGGTSGEAELAYTYGGQPVGRARARLSESYLKEHPVQAESKEGEEKVADKKESREKAHKKGIFSKLKGWFSKKLEGKTKKEKMIMAGLCGLLVVLVASYVRIRLIRRKKRRRR